MIPALWLLCLDGPDHGPANLNLPILQRRLSGAIADQRFESKGFYRSMRKCVWRMGGTWKWQPTYGPTPILVATVSSSWHFPMASIAFWKTNKGSGAQVLDQIQLTENRPDDYRVDGQTYRKGDRMVRCGSGTDNGNWEWPSVEIFRLRKDRWIASLRYTTRDLAAWPGPHFARRRGSVDPTRVLVSIYDYPEHLAQPHVGPLLLYNQTWRIVGNRVRVTRDELVQTPVAELDRLAALAQAGKRRAFDASVPADARTRLWNLLQRKIDVDERQDWWSPKGETLHLWWDGIHPRGSVELSMFFVKRKGRYRLVKVVGPPEPRL